jgi:YesN/AraC family two-component response regulator
MSIKVLIADDHEVVRLGIKSLLADTEIEIAAEASDGEEAIAAVRASQPDVVLLDVRMPQMDGLTALGRLRMEFPKLKILILSTYDNPHVRGPRGGVGRQRLSAQRRQPQRTRHRHS